MDGASQLSSFYGNGDFVGKGEKDPKKVAGMFEAIFYRMLLKQAREGSGIESIFDSPQMRMVQEMRDDELAQHLGSKGELGVMQLVLDHVEKTEGEQTVQPEEFSKVFGSVTFGSVNGLLKN